MKQYGTYISDLDGVLLYTLDDLTVSVNHAMKSEGFREYSVDEVRTMVCNGIRKLIECAVPDGNDNPKYEETYKVFISHGHGQQQRSTVHQCVVGFQGQGLHDRKRCHDIR